MLFGTNQGGHDGFSLLEEYLNFISHQPGVSVSIAVGNESQTRHHTHGLLAETSDTQNIQLSAGDDLSDIYVSIWNAASDLTSISVTSPTGEVVERIPAKSATTLHANLIFETSRVVVEYYFPAGGTGAQLTVVKILSATPGIWTITIHGDIILDGTYHAWLPITDFVSPNVRFLTPTPEYTIVVPATTIGLISCGAYNSLNNSLYANTSWGPSRLPALTIDLVAPGVNVGGSYPNRIWYNVWN